MNSVGIIIDIATMNINSVNRVMLSVNNVGIRTSPKFPSAIVSV